MMNEGNLHVARKPHGSHRPRSKQQETVRTGAWLAEEDDRLRDAVKKFGNRWSSAATHVKTRSGDQCAKRWNENLKPGLDHSPWEPQEDDRLLGLTETYGRNWKFIADNYLKTRAALALKNRYSLLKRRQRRAELDQANDDSRLVLKEAQPDGRLSSGSESSSPMTQGSGKRNFDLRSELMYAESEQGTYSIPSSATSNCSALDHDTEDTMICETAVPAWDQTGSFWHDYNNILGLNGGMLSSEDSMPSLVEDSVVEHQDFGSIQQFVWPEKSCSPEIGEHAGKVGTGATEVEYSVTCQRSKLKTAVNHLMDAAMSHSTTDMAQNGNVTVKICVRT